METIIKDLPIPKEVIEVQEALPLPEQESGGLSGGEIAIVSILVGGAIALLAKSKFCKKLKTWRYRQPYPGFAGSNIIKSENMIKLESI